VGSEASDSEVVATGGDKLEDAAGIAEHDQRATEQRLVDDMLALTQIRGSRDLSREAKDKFDEVRRDACGVKNQIQHSIVDEALFQSTLRDLDGRPGTCAELTK
jgi:hypothetical protein